MQNQNKLTNQVLECSHNALATRQTTNQIAKQILAKQIINQATKTKQILLNTSIKLLTLISVLTISNYLCAMTPSRTDKTKSDRMAELAKRAEDMYAASSAEKAADKVPTPVVTPAPKAATIETAKLESDKSEPKTLDRTNLDNPLDKHGNITDDFWKELSQCQKCPPSSERIDCKTILRDNPAWQKIVPMDRKTKEVIMDKMLRDFDNSCAMDSCHADAAACSLVCAVCAGANPNQTVRYGAKPEPLRIAYWRKHFGLFSLLLEKGANPSAINELIPVEPHVCDFAVYLDPQWLNELAKYGQKCTKARSRLRDGR